MQHKQKSEQMQLACFIPIFFHFNATIMPEKETKTEKEVRCSILLYPRSFVVLHSLSSFELTEFRRTAKRTQNNNTTHQLLYSLMIWSINYGKATADLLCLIRKIARDD
ncbi:hypothetical protein Tsp_07855 [Trichinella spiralis]|uniref:hypothetical protein n=1 Tax=Trichinella spiralis TaxID=6334 RepID=UPI0001EFD018|nr:hypothetical protein Tsp_07855 [Trichinella spiralis]